VKIVARIELALPEGEPHWDRVNSLKGQMLEQFDAEVEKYLLEKRRIFESIESSGILV
jgi:hypothetical protein